ncbi:hypothetical protein [Sphingomonas bacterium]|nr:hypothetical protein [Sphingomonas bacterium]
MDIFTRVVVRQIEVIHVAKDLRCSKLQDVTDLRVERADAFIHISLDRAWIGMADRLMRNRSRHGIDHVEGRRVTSEKFADLAAPIDPTFRLVRRKISSVGKIGEFVPDSHKGKRLP